MTKEDAINYLKNSMAISEDDNSRYHNEVLEFTIKALEQEPCIPTRDLSDKELKHFAEEMKKVRPQVIEQEPRWIPVSEGLPKTFEFVNCTCHSLIDDREDWVVETVYIPQPSDSPYSDWGNIPMLNEDNCEVVAWMHRDIPQPYKAESEEEICR